MKIFSRVNILVIAIILIALVAGFRIKADLAAFENEKYPLSRDAEVILPLDAVLATAPVISGMRAEYWEHIYNGAIHIKNDYILIHRDVDTNKIVKYIKEWRDIELPDVEIRPFTPPGDEYTWKRVVAFLDDADPGHFYTFYDIPEYPLICWEVRYPDGTTVMYDLKGIRIGHGIPVPTKE